jgi:hypothetical protein
MSVNVKDAVKEPVKVAEPDSVQLELASGKKNNKRFLDMQSGMLYEAGKIYRFTQAEAINKLSQSFPNGMPIFRRYRVKPVERVVVKQNLEVDMTKGKPKASPNAAVVVEKGRVNIGDDADIADHLREAGEEPAVPV